MVKVLYLVLSTAWISFWLGIAYASIGQTSEPLTYSWSVFFSMLLFLGITWFLGFLAGEDNY